MTKLTKEEIAAIVKKHGYKLAAEQRADTRQAIADDSTPSVAKVKAKYGGRTAAAGADAAAEDDEPMDDDDQIVIVDPETKRDAFTRGGRSKAKVISGKKKDIIGSQG
jgi:hypothetical protein